MYTSVNDPKLTRAAPSNKKPPGFLCETTFISVSLLMLKFYSDAAFDALSFMTVLLPMMIYFILAIMFNVLRFMELLHTEDFDEDAGLLSPKQMKLLFKIARNLLAYFGIYSLAGVRDKHVVHKELATVNLVPACTAI